MCRKASSDAVQLTLLRGLARFKLFLGAFLILSGFAHQMMVVMVMVQQIVGQVGQDLTVERHGSEDRQRGRHGREIGLWLHLVVVVLLLLLSVC
jgi:hypothetical protein